VNAELAHLQVEGALSAAQLEVVLAGGRVEGVVKRGCRCYPAAVAAALQGDHLIVGADGCRSRRLESADDLKTCLDRAGVARQFWPERLEITDGMPRTPSGKIKKYVLRQLVAGQPAATMASQS
jgi:hypothetical protein